MTVSGAAYADYTALFSESSDGVVKQVRILKPLLERVGIEVNPRKCVSFRIGVDGKQKK